MKKFKRRRRPKLRSRDELRFALNEVINDQRLFAKASALYNPSEITYTQEAVMNRHSA